MCIPTEVKAESKQTKNRNFLVGSSAGRKTTPTRPAEINTPTGVQTKTTNLISKIGNSHVDVGDGGSIGVDVLQVGVHQRDKPREVPLCESW